MTGRLPILVSKSSSKMRPTRLNLTVIDFSSDSRLLFGGEPCRVDRWFRDASCAGPRVEPVDSCAGDHIPEPDGKHARFVRHPCEQRRHVDPSPHSDFGEIRHDCAAKPAGMNVHELVFDEAVLESGAVYQRVDGPQRAREPDLFVEPAAHRVGQFLDGTRMLTAAVGPKAAGVILVRRALLQHQAPGRVEHEDRKRAMQRMRSIKDALPVRGGMSEARCPRGHLHSDRNDRETRPSKQIGGWPQMRWPTRI